MARKRKRTREEDSAKADLTPMIDVTFQLLIFFILCTRFKVDERNHQVQLPKDEGLSSAPSVPKEQVTIYCMWDEGSKSNNYVVAIDARGRKPVPDSYATLESMVIFTSDRNDAIRTKKALYSQVFNNLVNAVEQYIIGSGSDQIEKLEISFAVNAMAGATSGTAPWMFVSLAVDAATRVNSNRVERGQQPLTVTFKFADSMGRYAG
ncbi:MAG: biopolymer transporter ExbD [Planctomycetes bacterium]|nr:biopolymer transporter ExbD [Planctomycetota bacterium]MCW8134771.1 biopolymer transporter ExbD [Planctomycetota bacterium]